MSGNNVYIGSAGWSLPRQHAHLFGVGESMLARYATRFNAVEINSSFYRPHQRKTYERWAATVPADFRFSVKLPQSISHEQALRGSGPLLDAFLEQVEGLGRKLGVLLLQLPPGLAFEARVASTFFGLVRRRSDTAIACEPRHASWFDDRADALLVKHGIARVAADPARVPAAALPGGDTSWQYWRWHGSPRMYYSEYSQEALEQLAVQVRAYAGRCAPWVIFDNTAQGFAVSDAARAQAALTPTAPLTGAARRSCGEDARQCRASVFTAPRKGESG